MLHIKILENFYGLVDLVFVDNSEHDLKSGSEVAFYLDPLFRNMVIVVKVRFPEQPGVHSSGDR